MFRYSTFYPIYYTTIESLVFILSLSIGVKQLKLISSRNRRGTHQTRSRSGSSSISGSILTSGPAWRSRRGSRRSRSRNSRGRTWGISWRNRRGNRRSRSRIRICPTSAMRMVESCPWCGALLLIGGGERRSADLSTCIVSYISLHNADIAQPKGPIQPNSQEIGKWAHDPHLTSSRCGVCHYFETIQYTVH